MFRIQTEVVVMPICIAHEVVDHEPIVRGVTNRPFVCAEADGGAGTHWSCELRPLTALTDWSTCQAETSSS